MDGKEKNNKIENSQMNEEGIGSKEVKLIPVPVYILTNIGMALLHGLLWVVDLLWSMVTSLAHFFKMIGVGAYKGAIGIYKFFKRKVIQFKNNDLSGRLSYIFFGASSFAHKQYVNGVLFVLFEIGYILFLVFGGIHNISMLSTLGVNVPGPDPTCTDLFCDYIEGDNSVLVLVYGLLSVFSLALFGYIWNRSIDSGYNNYRIMNYVKYKNIINDNIAFSDELDSQIKDAVKNKVSSSAFKKEHRNVLEAKLNEINSIDADKTKLAYAKLVYSETISEGYEYFKLLEKQNKLLEKQKAKISRYIEDRKVARAKYEEKLTEENKEIKLTIFDQNTSSKVNALRRKENSLANKIRELEKRHSSFAGKESILNETKYGRYNIYYKHKAELNNEIVFYKNYDKLVEVFESSKGNFTSQNQENLDAKGNLKVDLDRKVALINKNYDEIENKKAQLIEELNAEDKAQEAEIKAAKDVIAFAKEINKINSKLDYLNTEKEHVVATQGANAPVLASIEEKINGLLAEKESLINTLKEKNVDVDIESIKSADQVISDIKAKHFGKISYLAGEIHNLPTDKAITAMRKEEIKEVEHAYKRDTKALKTNFTEETYSREMTVNYMVVEYNFEHSFAKRMLEEIDVVDKKTKEHSHYSKDVVAEKISNLEKEVSDFTNANPDCFVGKPKTFKETIASLMNENFHITILTLPIIGVIFFVIMPLVFSILVAFTNYSFGHVPPTQLFTWYGLENFKTLFNADPTSVYAALPKAMAQTIGWTIIWTIVATFSNYFLGIILALMINKKGIKLKKLWRTIFVLTIAIPQFISLLAIGVALKDTGVIGTWWLDTFHVRLGFGTNAENGAFVSKLIIILVNIWVGIPYTMLSTTGILLNIPQDLYESARVDGANTREQFTKITLPYILFVTGPHLISSFIGNVNNFNVIFFLTGGGPSISGSPLPVGNTDLLITFIYKIVTSNNNPQFGIASAIGIVVFILCAFFSIIMFNKSGSIKSEDQFQ